MFTNLKNVGLAAAAFFVTHTPAVFASGIFEEAESKGNELVDSFIEGPARLIALVAIVGSVIFFFMGKLPLKWLAYIVIGSLLLGSADTILDFLMG